MSGGKTTPGPMSGLRVLDFTSMLAGPACARTMADLGADVIKVEPPGGDHLRPRGVIVNGNSSNYNHLNLGKRCISVDLKNPKGVALLREMALKCDVLMEGFTPGTMKRFGLDYESLSKENPRLVYLSISGYGQTGPYAKRPAYGPMPHAITGYDRAQADDNKGERAPVTTYCLIADYGGGVAAWGAVSAALIHQARTGEGQHVDYALTDGLLPLMTSAIMEVQFPPVNTPYSWPALPTKDGGWVSCTPVTKKQFDAFIDATGATHLRDDPRFTEVIDRSQNWGAWMEAMAGYTKTQTTAALESMLADSACPFAVFKTVKEFFDDPQTIHRESFFNVDGGETKYKVANTFFRLSKSRAHPANWVAMRGQHNREILADLLGFGEDEVAALESEGALVAPD